MSNSSVELFKLNVLSFCALFGDYFFRVFSPNMREIEHLPHIVRKRYRVDF